ncbi:hypothetical protein [Sediminibacillus massiliensis]|uniref:hypothetical protein n=1 Tax=Sediminibacillus massiliensis TaxID=1926277 RepID=UPI0009882F23|nr:hypothetical protein [Sediminibacillus massiliensis]
MVYSSNIVKLFFHPEDHLFRIREAEKITHTTRLTFLLIGLCLVVYGWMSWLGIGSAPISANAVTMPQPNYETAKVWFLIARLAYALLFALFILTVPTCFFWLFYNIPFKKIVIMQLLVLSVLLVERLLWIPLFIYAGLEWYVSPLSFGIIASRLTEIPLLIHLLGVISIFQLWIVGFQVRYLSYLSKVYKAWIWTGVLLFHFTVWFIAAFVSSYDSYLINMITERW